MLCNILNIHLIIRFANLYSFFEMCILTNHTSSAVSKFKVVVGEKYFF